MPPRATKYTQEVAEYIRANCKGIHRAELARQLTEKFGQTYTEKQIISYCDKHGIRNGMRGKLDPTKRPPKGVYPPMLKKWHQENVSKGNPKYAVGDVVKRKGGTLARKVGPKKWVPEHRYVWEQANGPVPEGYLVTFKDGNGENCAIENLAIVTRAENVILNRCKLRFDDPELAECGIALAKLRVAAKKAGGET